MFRKWWIRHISKTLVHLYFFFTSSWLSSVDFTSRIHSYTSIWFCRLSTTIEDIGRRKDQLSSKMTILTKLPILAAARTAKHNRLLRRTTKVNPFTRGLLLGVVFILWMGLSQFYDDEDIQPSTTHKSKKIQVSV